MKISLKSDFKRLKTCGQLVAVGASSGLGKSKRNLVKIIKFLVGTPLYSIIKLMNSNKIVSGVNLLKIFEELHLIQKPMESVEMFNLSPKVDRIFKANEVQEAHLYIEGRKSKGKVLLSWEEVVCE